MGSALLNLQLKMKFILKVTLILLSAWQYSQAANPVRVQAVTVSSSEQCAARPGTGTGLESFEESLNEAIRRNIPPFPCECSNRDSSWTRVAYLNMADSSQTCPSAWAAVETPVRACGRRESSGGSCDSVFYSTDELWYTQVCGRINGYQYGSTNALCASRRGLETWYVDGVSLTHGSPGSRTHVWTFVNAWYEISTNKFEDGCPCMLSNPSEWPRTVPAFIGDNYFCATGTAAKRGGFLTDNPLWDGVGCTGSNTCCQFNQPPWFCRTLPAATSDDLEVRICANQETSNENTYISNIELYVR